MGITGDEVRISSKYLSAKLGTYTFTSPYNDNRNIADYISGMTDKFALDVYNSINSKWIYLSTIKKFLLSRSIWNWVIVSSFGFVDQIKLSKYQVDLI